MTLAALVEALGADGVLTGADCERYARDWAGNRRAMPAMVLRPRDVAGVSAALRIAAGAGLAVVPQGGNTGVCAGALPGAGMAVLSLERLAGLDIDPRARTARAGAGVTLQAVQEAAAAHGLAFPVEIGARGSATIGGVLATNAGGFNVLRHGNARALCLGLRAVLAGGQVVDLMTALAKDNTGYDLRDLLIGSEGTLAVITDAVLRLVPAPRVRATAFAAFRDGQAALDFLARAEAETGGLIEAFELLPARAVALIRRHFPQLPAPLARPADWGVLVELASAAGRDAAPWPDGRPALAGLLESLLAEALASGAVSDAALPQSEAQRLALWRLREASLEATTREGRWIRFDIALPRVAVPAFLEQVEAALRRQWPGIRTNHLGHLGDGNLHYSVMPDPAGWDAALTARIEAVVLDLVAAHGGSFAAEHGIGRAKPHLLARRKDPGALAAMRAIKAALDPAGILNPGAVLG
ncbi:MAG: D-2-hydroxyacid dehydrogenase [Paracoccaceae bacterium]|nr:MAG: D-2-hydroxyacid dehydrogenase [Paracoccaceae bacterium]